MKGSIICPSLPVTGARIVAGVRACPSMGDHQARRTMDAVSVMYRVRASGKIKANKPEPPKEFL